MSHPVSPASPVCLPRVLCLPRLTPCLPCLTLRLPAGDRRPGWLGPSVRAGRLLVRLGGGVRNGPAAAEGAAAAADRPRTAGRLPQVSTREAVTGRATGDHRRAFLLRRRWPSSPNSTPARLLEPQPTARGHATAGVAADLKCASTRDYSAEMDERCGAQYAVALGAALCRLRTWGSDSRGSHWERGVCGAYQAFGGLRSLVTRCPCLHGACDVQRTAVAVSLSLWQCCAVVCVIASSAYCGRGVTVAVTVLCRCLCHRVFVTRCHHVTAGVSVSACH